MFPAPFITVIWTKKRDAGRGNLLFGKDYPCRNGEEKSRIENYRDALRHLCRAVEESLANVKDVSKAQVNFGTDTAQVEFDPERSPSAISKRQ